MSSEALAALPPFQLRRIGFVKALQPDAAPLPEGLDIVVLNADQPAPDQAEMRKPRAVHTTGPSALISLQSQQKNDLSLQWRTVQRMGPGLVNLGNTCFMNSVLQCLTHTPPLAEALLADSISKSDAKRHASSAKHSKRGIGGINSSADTLAMTRAHIERSLRHRTGVISPVAHARSLRSVCKSFQRGRQEDAHEYLIALLDSMHTMAVGKPSAKASTSSQVASSLIHRIFAGRICSKVTCADCGYKSETYDPFLDISLEINRASSVTKAFERFTATESLNGSNKYKCPRQNRMVCAAKRMAVEEAPAVLVVQLKRFEFSARSRTKISKRVDFDTWLDLTPYMSKRQGPVRYQLFGVLVHHGHSLHAGHYVSFVRGPNGVWHLMDDSRVSQVSERMVLGQKAYILFYVRETNGSNGSLAFMPNTRADGCTTMKPQAQPPKDKQTSLPAERLATSSISHIQNGPVKLHPSSQHIASPQLPVNASPSTVPAGPAGLAKRKASPTEAQTRPLTDAKRQCQHLGSGDPVAERASPCSNAAATKDATSATQPCHMSKELARAIYVSRASTSPLLSRSQRRLERHLQHHHKCLSIRSLFSPAAHQNSHHTSPSVQLRSPSPSHEKSTKQIVKGQACSEQQLLPETGPIPQASSRRCPNISRNATSSSAPHSNNGDDQSPSSSRGPKQSDSSDNEAYSSSSSLSQDAVAAREESPPVDAPPWPPLPPLPTSSLPKDSMVQSPASISRSQGQQHPESNSREHRVSGSEVAVTLLQGGFGNSGRLAPSWQDDDDDTTAQPCDQPRPKVRKMAGTDDYDAAYDQGRVKKVRHKVSAEGGVSAAKFHAAWKQNQHRYGGGKDTRPASQKASGLRNRSSKRRGQGL